MSKEVIEVPITEVTDPVLSTPRSVFHHRRSGPSLLPVGDLYPDSTPGRGKTSGDRGDDIGVCRDTRG